MQSEKLVSSLLSGELDGALAALYAADGSGEALRRARERAARTVEGFVSAFGAGSVSLFSGPGRTEIGGNHTDHQHGHVLCASVDLDMLACASPNGTEEIRIISEGYPPLRVRTDCLSVRQEETGSSSALVRGVAAGVQSLGHAAGGFDVHVTSDVPAGSGLSSSAAYEVLIGNIINSFFCGGALSAIDIARIGQFAENVYFGKPCGLMDQMGSSVGGAVAIDFADPDNALVRPVKYDFSKSGHSLCITDTGSCHADLTDDYADITREMCAVAAHFGKSVLREVPEGEFRAGIPALRAECGDRAVLRAMHFYSDDRRAVLEAEALEAGDFERFLTLVNESGLSSELCLQNAWSVSNPASQPVSLALALGRELLAGEGAIRVHGGGFAGTIQAFVPNGKLETFKAGMEAVFGPGRCHVLHIRQTGGCRITH